MMLRPEIEWVYHEYRNPTEDLAISDLARLEASVGRSTGDVVRKRRREEGDADGADRAGEAAERATQKKLAVELQFTLPSSAYATMVVRELIKSSTSTQAQMDLNEG